MDAKELIEQLRSLADEFEWAGKHGMAATGKREQYIAAMNAKATSLRLAADRIELVMNLCEEAATSAAFRRVDPHDVTAILNGTDRRPGQ